MDTDHVWMRIDRELTRRKDKHLQPGGWSELGKLIDVTKQRRSNWKTRGIPTPMYQAIADALGWSVDALLGREPAKAGDHTKAVATTQTALGTLGSIVEVASSLSKGQQTKLLEYAQLLATTDGHLEPRSGPRLDKESRSAQRPMLVGELHRSEDRLIQWVPAKKSTGKAR